MIILIVYLPYTPLCNNTFNIDEFAKKLYFVGMLQLRTTLEGHFRVCGEITRLSIPKDYEFAGPKG